MQRSGFDSRYHQIFREVVDLERGPLSLVSTIEELLEKEGSCSGLENREYGRGDPLHLPRGILYPSKLAVTSPSGGRSVSIVRSWTKAKEFFYIGNSSCNGGAGIEGSLSNNAITPFQYT
jgi:hypothetical protein